jgi:flagellar capping protein FliD
MQMIKARFIKATPTLEGVTYTLQGPKDRVSQHSAVELADKECIIDEVKAEVEQDQDVTLESLDAIVDKINALTAKIRARGWHEKGVDVETNTDEKGGLL